MIVVLVPVIVAAAILLTQALNGIDRNQLSKGDLRSESRGPSLPRLKSPPKPVNHRTVKGVKSKPRQHPHVAQHSASGSKTNPSEKIAALQPAQSSVADKSVTREAATDAHSAGGGAADANVRTVQELVAAATVVAEKVTASRSDPEQKPKAGSERNTDSGKSGVTDPFLAIIIARPDIKSIDNLRGKIVAIDAKHSASNGNLRTAIAAAGAAEVQLSDSQTKAIDRVVSGEVAAAVVTLVSPEAADWFPEIAGYKTFRIPIGPSQLPTRR